MINDLIRDMMMVLELNKRYNRKVVSWDCSQGKGKTHRRARVPGIGSGPETGAGVMALATLIMIIPRAFVSHRMSKTISCSRLACLSFPVFARIFLIWYYLEKVQGYYLISIRFQESIKQALFGMLVY